MSTEAERAISGLFRVYIDSMLSPQYENEALFNHPRVGDTFKDYVSRATAGNKFGIIVNGAEQWSDPLARMGARIFAPVVHFHIGSTSKEMTLFSQKEFHSHYMYIYTYNQHYFKMISAIQ
ncbi:hypothetical protein [Photorhabdus viridis]|uniref:hypothetical protein n=1 Tax=Photorhabdus viridis TaxID=3163327 RepID=UPI003306A541